MMIRSATVHRPIVRARGLTCLMLAMCFGVLALSSGALAADSTLVMVREGAEIAGRPGTAPSGPRFGAPPELIAPIPPDPTVADAQAAIAGIEAWIGWAWRAGALSLVHGLASEDTRVAVDHAGRAVITGCARAMEMADGVTANLDRVANAADDRDAAAVIHARRVTLPLRAARAMIWIAESRGPDDPSTPRLVALAAALAGTVDVMHADAALERAVMLAHAGKAAGAQDGLTAALAEADRALALEDAAPSGATVIELDLLRARLAWMRRENDKAAALLNGIVTRSTGSDGTIDFGALMLAQSARARMVLDEGLRSRSPAVRTRAASSAAEIVRTASVTERTTERTPARRRAAMSEAMCGIGARLTPQDAWPGIVLASVTERALSVPGADVSASGAALEAWVASPAGADDPDADEVRLQLARALAMIGDAPSAAKAAQLAAQWVQSHETDDRAGAILALACAAGVEANGAGRLEIDRVRDLLERVDRAPYEVPNRDRWRLTLAGLLAQDLGSLGPRDSVARVTEIIALVRSMTSETDARAGAVIAGRSAVFLAARFEHEWGAWSAAGVTPAEVRTLTDTAAADLVSRGVADEAAVTRAEGLLVIGGFTEAEAAAAGIAGSDARADTLGILARAAAMHGDADGARTRLVALAGLDEPLARATSAWIAVKAWREVAPQERTLPEDVRDADRMSQLSRALLVSAESLGGDGAPIDVRRRAGIASALARSYPDAMRMLEGVWQTSPGDVDVALALADARSGTGDAIGAFALLYDIATARESARQLDRAYFRAWIRMLEVLGSQNTDGSRTAQIQRELARVLGIREFRDHPDLWDHAVTLARKNSVDVPG